MSIDQGISRHRELIKNEEVYCQAGQNNDQDLLIPGGKGLLKML